MNSREIRDRFLKFFEKRGHAVLPSASLVPENDPSVLFNTAGMQPLVPYLLGEKHPLGTRLVNLQKCLRTVDIEEIGDNTHATFFEMMGNWSLGDYFKKESINWSFELLTSKEEGYGLDPRRLYVTCFEGDEKAPKDTESFGIWQSIFEKHGIGGERIYYMPASKNWWQPGPNGPSGPDTEIFYDLTGKLTEGLTKEEYMDADDSQKIVEIWNNVFMAYEMRDNKVVGPLRNRNVDTGCGFERLTMTLQGKDNIFDTDVLAPLVSLATKLTSNPRSARIVADHMRSSIMMSADGVVPSNADQGYVLRRLIRKAVFNTKMHSLSKQDISAMVSVTASYYAGIYDNIRDKSTNIIDLISEESEKFSKTLSLGQKELDKFTGKDISGLDAFRLFSSFGLPIDLTVTTAHSWNKKVDIESFNELFKKHQELSRSGSENKFKGGLGDTSVMSVRYHTATHLLHKALRDVLGDHVSQKGSNITSERLRFDFTHETKMTDEEKKRVEDIVNTKIQAKLPVHRVEMKKEDAEKTGAMHFFGTKYGDIVSVYYIGDSIDTAFSKEFCGGPHVENTGELGTFKIQKEEAVAKGIRRIKAVLV
jgi:alanyl-tRNA synthetase